MFFCFAKLEPELVKLLALACNEVNFSPFHRQVKLHSRSKLHLPLGTILVVESACETNDCLDLCIVVQTYFHIFLYDRQLEFDGFQPLSVRLAFFKDMDFGDQRLHKLSAFLFIHHGVQLVKVNQNFVDIIGSQLFSFDRRFLCSGLDQQRLRVLDLIIHLVKAIIKVCLVLDVLVSIHSCTADRTFEQACQQMHLVILAMVDLFRTSLPGQPISPVRHARVLRKRGLHADHRPTDSCPVQVVFTERSR